MIVGKVLRMGRHSHIGKCTFRYYPKIRVGKFTCISSYVTFMGRCHHPSALDKNLVSNYAFFERGWGKYPQCGSRGHTRIGHDVWIGENVIIMDNVTIGNGAIIGTGAVVAKNVPDYAVVVGNPGKVIKYRFDEETIKALNKIAWWDWDDDKIKENFTEMKDIKSFIKKFL